MPQVLPVVVHHVAEETVEEIEPVIIRKIRRRKPEVPFADHAGVITRRFQQRRQEHGGRCEITPVVLGLFLTHQPRHPDAIRVTLIEPGAIGSAMQPFDAQERARLIKAEELLPPDEVAEAVMFAATRPVGVDCVTLRIEPFCKAICHLRALARTQNPS